MNQLGGRWSPNFALEIVSPAMQIGDNAQRDDLLMATLENRDGPLE